MVKLGKLSEYHPMDRDYVIALEYGMPPAGKSKFNKRGNNLSHA